MRDTHVSSCRPLALVIAAAAVVTACGSGGMTLPADAAGAELFAQAEADMEREKWRPAGEAYDTLLRNYPTSPHLPEARLGLGRAYYEQNRSDSLVLAIDAFRNFLTYHPSHVQVDYAQLMIAMSYRSLMRSPDRDQAHTKEALAAFEVFLEDYPDSQHRDLALENMQVVTDSLAAHELDVAEFQLGRKNYPAAQQRVAFALRKFGQTTHTCDLLYVLAESQRRGGEPGEASRIYQRIVDEHPDCRRAGDAADRVRQGGATRTSEEDDPGIR